MTPGRAVVSWSSGKDAAFALEEVRRTGAFEVVGLLTTVTQTYGRVSMHGVREALLERQAEALALPVRRVEIPTPCPNEVYDRAIGAALRQLYSEGVRHVIFGDLFLSDVRTYREERLAGTGLAPEFPLWGRPTAALARTMLERGVHATAVCVDPRRLPRSFAGREFDQAFLDDLPPGADPCGENGEFHTFVHDAPSFGAPVGFRRGEVVERDGFVFADLLLDASPNPIPIRNA